MNAQSSSASSAGGDFGVDALGKRAALVGCGTGDMVTQSEGGDMKGEWSQSCGGKQGHDSKDEAKAHRNNLIRKGNSLLEVYKCPWCDRWHVGHRPKGKSWGRATRRRRKGRG